jgi:hypothetical protein
MQKENLFFFSFPSERSFLEQCEKLRHSQSYKKNSIINRFLYFSLKNISNRCELCGWNFIAFWRSIAPAGLTANRTRRTGAEVKKKRMRKSPYGKMRHFTL